MSRLPNKKRLTHIALSLVVSAAVIEVLSLALHPLLLGRAFSSSAFSEIRRSIIERQMPGDTSPNGPDFIMREVLHPYLGYVARDVRRDLHPAKFAVQGTPGWESAKRSPGRLIVGITGGSVAAQLQGFASEHLRSRLSRLPGVSGREIVLINMSHGGWKQPQQLFGLTWLLALGGELDLLLDIDGFNEVALDGAENEKRNVFPAYPREWALRVDDLFDPDQAALLGAVVWRMELRVKTAALFSRGFLRWSPTANLFWRFLDGLLAGQLERAQIELSRSRSARDTERQIGPVAQLNPDERLDLLVDVWRRSSVELASLAAANGIAYFQFLQPNQYDEGAKPMGDAERKIAFREDHPYRAGARAGYPRLRASGEALRREGTFFHDLSRMFAAEHGPIFSDDCCHLSTEGYERLADRIADSIATDLAARH